MVSVLRIHYKDQRYMYVLSRQASSRQGDSRVDRKFRSFLFGLLLVCAGICVAATPSIPSWEPSRIPQNFQSLDGFAKGIFALLRNVAEDTIENQEKMDGQSSGLSNSSSEALPTSTSSPLTKYPATYLPCGGMTLSIRKIGNICWLGLESNTSEMAVLAR